MIGKILLQQGRSKLTGNCCRLNIRAKRTKRVEKLAMWTIAGLFCRNTLVGSDEMQIAKIQKTEPEIQNPNIPETPQVMRSWTVRIP